MTEKQRNMELDYNFLRDNDVKAATAIFMVGLAYKEDAIIVELPRKKVIDPPKGFRRKRERK
jgi:hypothetical protein